jgi:hypothetical protein
MGCIQKVKKHSDGFLVAQVKECAYHNPRLMRASYLLIKINKAPEETFLA